MEINDYNNFPGISIRPSTSVDTIVFGCDGGHLKTEAIIVLHHDRHYKVVRRRGQSSPFWKKTCISATLESQLNHLRSQNIKINTGQKYILHDLCLLRCLMVILVTVVLFSLGRDVKNLEYGKSYLARSMNTAVMKRENGAQPARPSSSYNIKQTRRSLSDSSSSQSVYETLLSRS